jgi:DNA sulfur modification protein DndB
MAALGAVGHPLVGIADSAQRDKRKRELLTTLAEVKWNKSKNWEGIAGKYTPKGRFSIAGAKDTAYAVYGALTDKSSEAFTRIRRHSENGQSPSYEPELAAAVA